MIALAEFIAIQTPGSFLPPRVVDELRLNIVKPPPDKFEEESLELKH